MREYLKDHNILMVYRFASLWFDLLMTHYYKQVWKVCPPNQTQVENMENDKEVN